MPPTSLCIPDCISTFPAMTEVLVVLHCPHAFFWRLSNAIQLSPGQWNMHGSDDHLTCWLFSQGLLQILSFLACWLLNETACSKGFKAQGSHLPKKHRVPDSLAEGHLVKASFACERSERQPLGSSGRWELGVYLRSKLQLQGQLDISKVIIFLWFALIWKDLNHCH